ncbi:hypothetical protein AMECASPLE_009379 [Ameca splendens]|uniref:Uncharacterized protein n=1 Tax=Ameca splendens TaxID=208324 RepID=A0ABV1A8N1_9TELE
MSSLMLGLQTNRQGQHYSEQSRDPPNSSLSLKQKSDHSSMAPVVLNRALLHLYIAQSEPSAHTLTPAHTNTLVSGELLYTLPSVLCFFLFFHYIFPSLFLMSFSSFALTSRHHLPFFNTPKNGGTQTLQTERPEKHD